MSIAERYKTQETASLEIYGKSNKLVAIVKNLSLTGAGIEWLKGNTQLNSGDIVRVLVDLRSVKKTYSLNAEVVWSIGNKGGVHFISSEQVLQKLMQRAFASKKT
jgi:hypothetical protein